MLEETGHQRLILRKSDHTVSDVARGQDSEFFPQSSRTPAIVGHRNHGRKLRRLLFESTKERGKARATSDGNDAGNAPRPPGRTAVRGGSRFPRRHQSGYSDVINSMNSGSSDRDAKSASFPARNRFSVMAYQGYGRRLRLGQVALVNKLATQDVIPAVTFLLDCPVREGLARVGAHLTLSERSEAGDACQRRDWEGTRRFEVEPVQFHERVRDGYRKLARKEPARWCVLDALVPADDIAESVWARVERELVQRHLTRESGRSPGFWEEGLDARPIDQAEKEPQR